jgi:hypothetical protein
MDGEMLALLRARRMLQTDVSRLDETVTQLIASDEAFLQSTQSALDEGGASLTSANDRLDRQRRRASRDSLLLWASWAAYGLCVAYIWGSRLFG